MGAANTIAEYIAAAPAVGQPHLRQLYAILKQAAPEAEEAIKWGTPFFVEPRFVFAFSAHKAHMNLALTEAVLQLFADALAPYKTTRNLLQLPYQQPLPEALIQKLAEERVREVGARTDEAFW